MITTLFFDFAGVITTSKLFPKVAEMIAASHNISQEEIQKALYTDPEKLACGVQSKEEFWELYLQPLGVSFDSFESSMQQWYTLRYDLLEYIDSLKIRGYKIHVLSDNFDVCTKEMRQDEEFTKHFDNFYFSNEVHISKSGTEFFEYALKDAGVSASESIFIDDKQENVERAERIQLKGVLFQDLESFQIELNRILGN